MNDEQSGGAEDRGENTLKDSCEAAVASDGQQNVRPPDSKRFQMEMDEITQRIQGFETKLKSLEKEMSSCSVKATVCINKDKLHGELQDLRAQREKVIEERKQFDVELKGLNMQVQKKNDACTKLQAGVRYKTETRIDEAVRKLQHQMQAQQLKLSEEKRLVAEIDILKRSKRNLNDYLALKQLVDQLRNKQKIIRGQRDACVKRINGLKSREEEIKNLLDSDATDASEETETQHLEQLNEIGFLRKELDELYSKKRDMKTTFTKERNEYYSAVREMRSQKQKDELTRRKKERLATLRDVSSNRSKQQLYEKEKALCDTLMNHFEKLHTNPNTVQLHDLQLSTSPDKEPVVSLPASTCADFSKSDGEGTFLRRKSATDDLVGVFAGLARSPRRGSRKGRRSSAKEVPRRLNLHPEVLEHLLALDLSPPSTAADIPKVLEELQEKKDFYERATTSSTMLHVAPPSNDPMSPITEEAAPEFPSLLKDSNQSETPGDVIQAENTLSVKDGTKDEDGNFHENYKGVGLTLYKEEQVTLSQSLDKSNSNTLNGLLSKMEGRVASLDLTWPQHKASSNKNNVTHTEAAVSNSNCGANAAQSAVCNLLNSADKLYSEESDVPCPVNKDDAHTIETVYVLDETMSNCIENDKGVEGGGEEKVTCSNNNQMDSNCNVEITPKEGSYIQDVQNHSNFTSSSPHNSSLLLGESGLETTFDRNSLNEGGSLMKVQCEKCPA